MIVYLHHRLNTNFHSVYYDACESCSCGGVAWAGGVGSMSTIIELSSLIWLIYYLRVISFHMWLHTISGKVINIHSFWILMFLALVTCIITTLCSVTTKWSCNYDRRQARAPVPHIKQRPYFIVGEKCNELVVYTQAFRAFFILFLNYLTRINFNKKTHHYASVTHDQHQTH